MKHKNKLKCPFKLDEVYLESLQNEIKTLERDIVDMYKCKVFLRCPSCERVHDKFDKCPHCGNKTRDYQLRRLTNKSDPVFVDAVNDIEFDEEKNFRW